MHPIVFATHLFAAAVLAVCLITAARLVWVAFRRLRRRPWGVRRLGLDQVDLPDDPPRFFEAWNQGNKSRAAHSIESTFNQPGPATAPSVPAPEGHAHVYVWSGAAGGYHFVGTRPIKDIELGTPPMQHVNQLPHPLVPDHVDA